MPLTLYQRNRNEIRFIVLFLLYFASGQALYALSAPMIAPVLIDKMTVAAGVGVINLITPDEQAVAAGRMLRSNSASLTVAIGCEGVEGWLIILAAIGAFRMPWRHKAGGMVLGALVLYAANLLRVVALFYTSAHQPEFFGFAHIYIGQVFTIFTGLCFFLFWIGRSGVKHAAHP